MGNHTANLIWCVGMLGVINGHAWLVISVFRAAAKKSDGTIYLLQLVFGGKKGRTGRELIPLVTFFFWSFDGRSYHPPLPLWLVVEQKSPAH